MQLRILLATKAAGVEWNNVSGILRRTPYPDHTCTAHGPPLSCGTDRMPAASSIGSGCGEATTTILIKKMKQEILLVLMGYGHTDRHTQTFDVLVYCIDQKNTGSLRELSLRSSSSPHVSPD